MVVTKKQSRGTLMTDMVTVIKLVPGAAVCVVPR